MKKTPRFSKFLANLTNDQLQALRRLADGDSLNLRALHNFEELMRQHGRDIYNAFRLLGSCQVFSARFQRFMLDDETGQWYSDEVRTASPAYGFTSMQSLKAELTSMAAEGEHPSALAGLFYVLPGGDDPSNIVLALMSDMQGNQALGFGLDVGWRWAPADMPMAAQMLEALCVRDPNLGVDFFSVAATRLVEDLKARNLVCKLPEGEGCETVLVRGLQREMREIGNAEAVTLAHLTESFWVGMKRMREATDAALAKAKADVEKTYEKRTKALLSRVETAELLAKGSQQRAHRLSTEMQALRQQSKKMAVAGAPAPEARSLGQALDKLFG